MLKWLPLILGMLTVTVGGFFTSLAIAHTWGQTAQVIFIPINMLLGVIVGFGGTAYALNKMEW